MHLSPKASRRRIVGTAQRLPRSVRLWCAGNRNLLDRNVRKPDLLIYSVARGEASEASDVDLCLETGSSFSLLNAGALSLELERELEAPIELVTERSLYPFVREGMLRDRVLLYERV